jgi:hypothetical protein
MIINMSEKATDQRCCLGVGTAQHVRSGSGGAAGGWRFRLRSIITLGRGELFT